MGIQSIKIIRTMGASSGRENNTKLAVLKKKYIS